MPADRPARPSAAESAPEMLERPKLCYDRPMDDQKSAKQPSKGERLEAAMAVMSQLTETPHKPRHPTKARLKSKARDE